MKSSTESDQHSRKWLLLIALLSVPGLLWAGQKKQQQQQQQRSSPPPSRPAPASRQAAPQQRQAPPQQRPGAGAGQQRPSVGGPQQRPGAGGPQQRSGVDGPQPQPGAANAGRPGTAAPPRPAPRLTRTVPLRGGGTATIATRSNGKPAVIHTQGVNGAMTISHPLRGSPKVVQERNGRTIVATGRSTGYVQRNYVVRNNTTYVQRTYVVNNVTYTSVYRTTYYDGVAYYGYAPVCYYRPAFYGWAYDPWVVPLVYGPSAWGWVGSPWYGFYGGYFSPEPVYPTASLWLTDYLLAADLQAAYGSRAEAQAHAAGEEQGRREDEGEQPAAAPAGGGQTQLTPEVKHMIAEEVKSQLAAERTAAANPQQPAPRGQVPDALNPAERVFIVSSSLDVAAADDQECALTPGDVVMRVTDSPDENQNVAAIVQSSKQSDCARGATVAVGVQDLQEMHNQFRQQLDAGLKTLASNSGKGGLPPAPDTTTTNGEVPPPAADANAAAQVSSAQQDAKRTEQAVQQAGPGS